ncbi:MAG: hypothetical protein BYD32DRAFT_411331 [Podila humilis]|nr:MAG: hypothetical protein BYD32DRAFT_411331 [Podila humilis]
MFTQALSLCFFTFLFDHRVSSRWCTIHPLDTPPRFLCFGQGLSIPIAQPRREKKGKGNKVWRDARTEIFRHAE